MSSKFQLTHTNQTVLPSLPDSLQILECHTNCLTQLPPLPPTLIELKCYSNMLTCLPDLPSSLKVLECDKNLITLLPDLPSSLEYLDCETNLLRDLPPIPDSLEVLYCGDNQLTTLPPLSKSLLELSCGSNQLTMLPALPSRLIEFSCGDNLLSHLPTFPPTLQPHYLECFLQNPWNTHFEQCTEQEDWIAGIQDYHSTIQETKRSAKTILILYHSLIQILSDDILHAIGSFLSGRKGTMQNQIQQMREYVEERPHAISKAIPM